MDMSVITATRDRPQQLACCVRQFLSQSVSNLKCEHIVVSDGPDPRAAAIALAAGARYYERDEAGGAFGAFAKDIGLQHASGEYVCFWDDDNWHEPHALSTLYAIAHGFDIGVAQIRHLNRRTGGYRILPEPWSGAFELGNIDTLCICIRREVALNASWGDSTTPRHTDYHWLERLARQPRNIRFVPIVIGSHL